MELMIYLLAGAIAGLMAGLLGIGGGLVIVPALAMSFASQGFAEATRMHFAIGTSLATIIVTSMSSLLAHHRRGGVDWLLMRRMAPGMLTGALGGAWLAGFVSSPGLSMFFGVFELLVALQLACAFRPAAHGQFPGRTGLGLAGTIIGAVSALLGIGGATLTVPFLLWNRVDIRTAVGTAAACGLPIALGGTAAFALGKIPAGSPQGFSTGFIYWPAVAGIGLTSILMAPVGAGLAHQLPLQTLQRVFALLVMVVGLKMVFNL
jgi:uncharacterized membrane protein YfcA